MVRVRLNKPYMRRESWTFRLRLPFSLPIESRVCEALSRSGHPSQTGTMKAEVLLDSIFPLRNKESRFVIIAKKKKAASRFFEFHKRLGLSEPRLTHTRVDETHD
jgi:hypothetical protein